MTPPRVILDQPQLAMNIGAAARVMANFGLSDLRLVRPRDGWPQEKAWASASGADWPLEGAKVHERLEAAVADLSLVFATTARPREANLPILTPREAAAQLAEAAAAGLKTGLLFGGERAGLETQDIALCQAVITIPIDPKFRSLNLAQAISINAYEWWVTQAAGAPPAFRESPPPAEHEAVMGLFQHLEDELEKGGFFHPPEKTPAMIRNLRSALGRARLTDQEVRTLRGAIVALTRGRGRVLEKLSRKRQEEDG